MGFVLMFGLIGAAQMVFGVVGPFLYEVDLGFSPATYGLVALMVGAANLTGERACGGLSQRTGTRQLALGAWAVFVLGAVIIAVGVNAWAITLGAALALLGIGVLDPQSKGLAMGEFTRNIGLIAGLVNTCCYLIVSAAMGLMAYLPEESQAPLGWLYLALASVFVLLLLTTVPRPQVNSVQRWQVRRLERTRRRTRTDGRHPERSRAAAGCGNRVSPVVPDQ